MDLKKVHVGGTLKTIANQKGMSTYHLQNLVNMSNQAIGKIYRKESIQTDLLHKFSQAFGVNLYDVISYLATEPEPAQDFLAVLETRKLQLSVPGLSEPTMRLTIEVPESKQKDVLEMVQSVGDDVKNGGTQ